MCDVELVRGVHGPAEPDLLLEVAHGATLARDYDRLRSEVRSPLPPDLRAFFFANTDVGAPEVAQRVAEHVVAADPRRTALVVRCRIPRTFLDCNRIIDAQTVPRATAAGEMTAGIHAWIRDPADLGLLLARYRAYRELVTDAFERVCGAGGTVLFVHSYAPRSVDVQVDERIVERLRAEYEPDRIGRWPLRAAVDLIVDTPEGERLAHAELADAVQRGYEAIGLDVARNGAYALHPATIAHELARRHPGRSLCLELRRDLLVREFTPFQEMIPDPARVDRIAAPLSGAIRSQSIFSDH